MRAFLLPAILGDEPQLSALRDGLEGRIDFDLLELPGIDAPAALLSCLGETARVLVGDIVRRQPTGDVAMVGFSFGASLALEVTAQLIRVGRVVSWLAILDGAFSTGELRRSNRELLRLCVSWQGLASLARRLSERLTNRMRLVAVRLRSARLAQNAAVRDALLMDLRCKALNGWHPPACRVPGLLIVSGALGAENRRRWAGLCPNLAIVTIEAAHGDLLKGRSLGLIVQALAGASP